MSDNSERRHTKLMEAWLHKWSDDRARDLREQKQKSEQKTPVSKPKSPSI